MNNRFFFKKFDINSYDCGMPISTDGVLLGSWAASAGAKRILDIGTGTGLLALMMAQRYPDAKITALDIDSKAFEAAKQNVDNSPFKARIYVFHADIQGWQSEERFDLIICNPPYFNHGEQSQNLARATARHTDSLPHKMLINAIKNYLAPQGSAHLILPSFEARQFIEQAKALSLYCVRQTLVQTTEKKAVSRVLFSLSHLNKDCEQKSLCIHSSENYSQDFIALTKDFYLKM